MSDSEDDDDTKWHHHETGFICRDEYKRVICLDRKDNNDFRHWTFSGLVQVKVAPERNLYEVTTVTAILKEPFVWDQLRPNSSFADLCSIVGSCGFVIQRDFDLDTYVERQVRHDSDGLAHGISVVLHYFRRDHESKFDLQAPKTKTIEWYWRGTQVTRQEFQNKKKELSQVVACCIGMSDLRNIICNYLTLPVSHGQDVLNDPRLYQRNCYASDIYEAEYMWWL